MTALLGKVALVTGGARGIGRGIALALAGAGADVALAHVGGLASARQHYGGDAVGADRAAEATAGELAALGRRAKVIRADVSRKADAERMVAETVRELGGIDILVCAAGVVSLAGVEELSEQTWDLTFAVNAKGVFLSCQAAIAALRTRGGCIINLASVAGKNGQPGLAHYCASKFAVVGFTNALAKELAPAIRVNAICPGIVRTQMWEYLAEMRRQPGESKDEAWARVIRTRIPLGRPQGPDDVGQLAVYLATAPNVTGQAINVDGGMELH